MGRFDTTRWSLVLRARGEPVDARAALDALCRTYRPAVLAFVRSRGYPPESAEDLTQAFFARFVESAWHASADPERGRFRSFLLTALKRFLIDADAESRALKRGGAYRFQTLDEDMDGAAVSHDTPEAVFQREWTCAVLRAAFTRLRAEAEEAGKLALFERLVEFVVERPDAADYARVADELQLRRNTLAVAVHRLRQRLRELVREELAETVADQDGIASEVEALRASLGRPQ